MPGTTITISGPQRNGLYELVCNHLGSVGDLGVAGLEGEQRSASSPGRGLTAHQQSAATF